MLAQLLEMPMLWLTLTIGLYLLSGKLQKRWPNNPLFVPLVFAIVVLILILLLTGVPLETYQEGGHYLSLFITPATVSLAVKLEKNFDYLKQNYQAILIGIFSGVIFHTALIYLFAFVFNFGPEMVGTLIPKSITTAIAMGISESLGGIVPMTVAIVIFTGVIGAVIGEHVYRIFNINDPVAQGVAMGSSAHGMGTTIAIQMGEVQGAMSGLTIVVTGLIVVALAPLTVPLTAFFFG